MAENETRGRTELKTVIKKNYVDWGAGFPVVIDRVEVLVKPYAEIPLINYGALEQQVLLKLANQTNRLTGLEIQYIRKTWRMTLKQFADLFQVTHPAVKKWESCGAQSTNMNWATEKDMRLQILHRGGCSADSILALYDALAKPFAPSEGAEMRILGGTVKLDGERMGRKTRKTRVTKCPAHT